MFLPFISKLRQARANSSVHRSKGVTYQILVRADDFSKVTRNSALSGADREAATKLNAVYQVHYSHFGRSKAVHFDKLSVLLSLAQCAF